MKSFLPMSLLVGSVLFYMTMTPSFVHSYPSATATSLKPLKGSAILERDGDPCSNNCATLFRDPLETLFDEKTCQKCLASPECGASSSNKQKRSKERSNHNQPNRIEYKRDSNS